jgi:hypothetical protein
VLRRDFTLYTVFPGVDEGFHPLHSFPWVLRRDFTLTVFPGGNGEDSALLSLVLLEAGLDLPGCPLLNLGVSVGI